MRTPLRAPVHVEPRVLTRGDRRRRSLRRGIDLWVADTSANMRPRARVGTLALTFTDPDPDAAIGAIRAFWQAYRGQYGKRAYFSWVELQYRGAIHYHAILIDHPWRLERHARRWLRRHWPHSGIQPHWETRDETWFRRRGGRYVKEYAKAKWKPRNDRATDRRAGRSLQNMDLEADTGRRPDKSYQQDYDDLPRTIRTWECSRLSHTVREVATHIDRVELINTAPLGAPWPVRMRAWWIYERVQHRIPTRGWCNLAAKKSGAAQHPAAPLKTEEPGDHTTECSRRDESLRSSLQPDRAAQQAEQLSTLPLPFA